jgi:hypothetical protein
MQKAGMPDILFIWHSIADFFEVKRPGKKPTKLQAVIHKQLRKAGCGAYVVTSVEEVEKALDIEPVTARRVTYAKKKVVGKTYSKKRKAYTKKRKTA